MNEEIDYKSAYESVLILKDMLIKENQQLKQYDKNKDTRNSRQRVANYELLKENKRLKEENIKLQMKYISVLDEIREYIESNKREASSHFNGKEYVFINYWLECDPNDLLQILDKVK